MCQSPNFLFQCHPPDLPDSSFLIGEPGESSPCSEKSHAVVALAFCSNQRLQGQGRYTSVRKVL
jgi:hypothetical protein